MFYCICMLVKKTGPCYDIDRLCGPFSGPENALFFVLDYSKRIKENLGGHSNKTRKQCLSLLYIDVLYK